MTQRTQKWQTKNVRSEPASRSKPNASVACAYLSSPIFRLPFFVSRLEKAALLNRGQGELILMDVYPLNEMQWRVVK